MNTAAREEEIFITEQQLTPQCCVSNNGVFMIPVLKGERCFIHSIIIISFILTSVSLVFFTKCSMGTDINLFDNAALMKHLPRPCNVLICR